MSNQVNRPRGRPFTKGDPRINAGGRPKVPSEFKRRCSDFTDEHVVAAWEQEVMQRGENWVRASELLAAYGKGKPTQPVEDVTNYESSSTKHLLAQLPEALAVLGDGEGLPQ
jgi:hypothetical protein